MNQEAATVGVGEDDVDYKYDQLQVCSRPNLSALVYTLTILACRFNCKGEVVVVKPPYYTSM